MMELDFSFEKSPAEVYLDTKRPGETVSAAGLIALLEEESEDLADEVLNSLDDRGLILSISELPKASGTGAAALRLRQEEQLVQKGLPSSELDENDPLHLFLEEMELARVSEDEECLLARASANDEKAMALLAEQGIQRVIKLAQEYVGHGVLLMDLIQEGSLGLWQAIQSFRGGDYGVFRDSRIRNAMARAITLQARSSGVFRKMREAMEDYRAVDERLLSELGRNPTLDEIAEEIHMSREETQIIQKMMDDARMIQSAVKPNAPETDAAEDEQAVEDTAYFQTRQRIMELLSGLDDVDAQILSLRFGLEKGLPLSPEETGKRLGLTPDEVVSREAGALSMLRSQD